MDIKGALNRIADGKDLTGTEMRQVMDIIMSGEATASQIGAFLMGMRVKGESVGEIAAAVSIMRKKMVPVDAPDDAIDIVGTGGDGAGTLNISTGASIVVAAAGVPVAKHGNRALSSKSGSAEALQKLGISLELSPEQISACIREAGIGFMFAPNHHPAMRHVGPTRSEMGVRTMFNLLGPQSNPAGVKRYVLGVFDNEWVEPVAAALLANQAQSAWVMHGDSGLDELSTTGPSFVSQIKNGNLTSFEVTPEDAGLPRARLDDIIGGDPEYNAGELRKLLDGAKGAYRDIVLFNAAAAFIVAEKVETLPEGVAMGAEAIDSGKARATLEKLVAVSGAQ
ncbi:anthranilate phosphoribosyltransferase [Pelagibacterium sp.]|uniref:anthranilate phosphoribosyltransferase n=1 Tax=Pelagibacterium sp. TaxID=1967288 RepID=UPI003A8FB62E